MGTWQIQDGCRDSDNVHLYTTACYGYNFDDYTHALAFEEFNGTISNDVRLCSCDNNSKWSPCYVIIAQAEDFDKHLIDSEGNGYFI